MSGLVALWVVMLGWLSSARADTPDPVPEQVMVTAKEVKDQILPDKKDKDEAASAAEEEEEKRRKEKLARVIVLKWNGKSADYRDTNLTRNVRSRIARPDAQFYPDVDLYQNGRKVRDRTVVPAMQPAVVPEQNITRVLDAVDEVAAIPERSMRPEAWGAKATELAAMVELIWFVERVDLREPLFKLYAQIGRAAKFQDAGQPPFFDQIGQYPVNYYYYLAALLAHQDPSLMNKLTDDDVREDVNQILTLLKRGAFPTLQIDFQQQEEGDFVLEEFNKIYEIYLNGIKLEDLNEQGQYDVFLGRTDIYLKRKDNGHGLSERLEVTKLENKIIFVRDTARKKMGLDFIRQLFEHENECLPSLDGDILNYLSIYAKIHEKAEIYIAVPKYGNANKVFIWRYDRPTANLQLVQGGGDNFPVRFAILASTGIMYNGADPSFNPEVSPSELITAGEDGTTSGAAAQAASHFAVNLAPTYIPLDLQLRGSYNRLMVQFGIEAGFNTGSSESGSASWTENYHLAGNPYGQVFASGTVTPLLDEEGNQLIAEDGTPLFEISDDPVYNSKKINRNIYLEHAVVLGRDAAIGFGPRLGLRIGWTNLPYALQTTLHAGWSFQIPGVHAVGRVRPLIDIDARGGPSFPFKTSMSHDSKIAVDPVFGLTAGIGTTF